MNDKLTLRIDKDLIDRAKAYARDKDTSVSSLVASFFNVLPETGTKLEPSARVRALRGVIKGVGTDHDDYIEYLAKKYE
ncbi:MAG: hypothetical protein GKR94_28250 [Gammaproteobacteria bacterium]|nr:hypothetical protein [Gammaproteobacteria bacterium]